MKHKLFFIKRACAIMFIAIAVMSSSQDVFGQDRWSFEFRPAFTVPTAKLGDENVKNGLGLEGAFAYRFMPHLSVYAGWGWNRFAASNSDFEETGYTYGLQFIYPLGTSKVDLFTRLGALSNHIEIEDGDEVVADSGHGFGWQVEGGIVIHIVGKWRALPSIRYRSLSRDIDIGSVSTAIELKYLSLGFGISRSF